MTCIAVLALLICFSPSITADPGDLYVETPGTISDIGILNLFAYPETLAPFETGTITFTIKNIGRSAAQIESIGVDGKGIIVTNDLSNQRNTLGIGDMRDFTFSFLAPGREDTYYPSLIVKTSKSGYTRYPFSVKVDGSKAQVAFTGRSAPFSAGVSSDITLQVSNLRSNTIRAVSIRPVYDEGSLESIVPSALFIGELSGGSFVDATFSITPLHETTVQFVLEYMNGDNPNEVLYELHVTPGLDKKLASPILSNVVVTNAGSYYSVSGSISNAGLEKANGIVLTSSYPAVPIYPDKEYVVGVLKPDDFSRTFTLTFKADPDVRQIPIIITYKDDYGNVYTIESTVHLSFSPPTDEKPVETVVSLETLPPPWVTAGSVIAIIAGLYVLYRLLRWKTN